MIQEEFDFYITPDGGDHNLHDFDSRVIMSHDGYGMPPARWLTSRGPFQHGETALDFRLRPRIFRLILRWKARSRSAYWDARLELLEVLRPNRSTDASPGQLRKVLPNGDIRDIDVHIHGGPTYGPEEPEQWMEWSFQQLVQLIAYDPTFYDPTQRSYAPVPVVGVGNVTLPGSWLSWPIIQLSGLITDPVITNVTLGEAITLTYANPAPRTITFDLRPGRKTVEDDLGTNLIGYVTGDLATWRLEVDPVAAGGVNQIQIAAGWVGGGETALFAWYDRWIGI